MIVRLKSGWTAVGLACLHSIACAGSDATPVEDIATQRDAEATSAESSETAGEASPQAQALADLDASEREALCASTFARFGGEGITHTCGSGNDCRGELHVSPTATDCAPTLSRLATCGVSVRAFQACMAEDANDPCATAAVEACQAIRACLAPEAGTRWVGLAAGWNQTWGVTDTGALHSWGNCTELPRWNPSGRFSEVATAMSSTTPAQHKTPLRTCAARADVDELVCWDELGLVERHPGRFRGITVGPKHYCAIDADKIAHCWGDDLYGQTGWAAVNAGLSSPRRARSVSAGSSHTCIVFEPDSKGECFGNDSDGQSKATLATLAPVTQMLAHFETSCGLASADGELRCAGAVPAELGSNGVGEPETTYATIALGGHGYGSWASWHPSRTTIGLSQCGIRKKDGEAECVGLVSESSIDAYEVSSSWPGAPPSAGPYQSLAAGFEHVCAIRTGGQSVVCWGVNDASVTTAPEL